MIGTKNRIPHKKTAINVQQPRFMNQIKTNTQENRRLQGEVTEVKNRMQSLDDKVGDLSQN